jgi:hypothetical protein
MPLAMGLIGRRRLTSRDNGFDRHVLSNKNFGENLIGRASGNVIEKIDHKPVLQSGQWSCYPGLQRQCLGAANWPRDDEMVDHETRRKIIRQWQSLPKDKRQTTEQAAAFARKAVEENELQLSRRDPYTRVMDWLLPRIGR